MKKSMYTFPATLFTLGLFCLVLAACASKTDEKKPQVAADPTSIEAKQVAAQNEARAVTEIQFSKGQAVLSAQAKKQLREMLDQTSNPKDVDSIKVIAWADHEYPSVHTTKLSKDQIKLAKNRLETIENFLKANNKDYNVDTFDMAKQPNALEKLSNTEDASLKKTLESLGIPNTYTAVKAHGKASKAIVMVVLKH